MLPSAAGFALMRKLLLPPVEGLPSTRLSVPERAAMEALESYDLASRGFKREGIDLRFIASCYRTGGDRKVQPAVRRGFAFVDNRGGLASYVPPAPIHISGLWSNLERSYLAVARTKSSLGSFALAFYSFLQFLAIHPLSDGNGRTSRLLFVKAAAASGIPEFFSLLVMGVLHTLMVDALHACVMDYCLTGSYVSALELFLLAVKKAKDIQHHEFWQTCSLVLPRFSMAKDVVQGNLAQLRAQYRGVAGVLV